MLSAGACFLVKPRRAQRSSVRLYIKFLGSLELLGCDHGLSKRLPPHRRRPRREQSWRQKTKTHQGLFKTPSSELRIMKALQLSVITAEGLDKNRVLVSWELSPFSTHYPSESSLDGSWMSFAGQLTITLPLSILGGQPGRAVGGEKFWLGARGRRNLGCLEVMKLSQ